MDRLILKGVIWNAKPKWMGSSQIGWFEMLGLGERVQPHVKLKSQSL